MNAWVAAVLFVASVLFFVWWQFLRPAAAAGRQHVPKAERRRRR